MINVIFNFNYDKCKLKIDMKWIKITENFYDFRFIKISD